jgi:hypothetical protein
MKYFIHPDMSLFEQQFLFINPAPDLPHPCDQGPVSYQNRHFSGQPIWRPGSRLSHPLAKFSRKRSDFRRHKGLAGRTTPPTASLRHLGPHRFTIAKAVNKKVFLRISFLFCYLSFENQTVAGN